MNNAFGAGPDEGIESDRIFVGIAVDDVDLREGIETGDVKLGVRRALSHELKLAVRNWGSELGLRQR